MCIPNWHNLAGVLEKLTNHWPEICTVFSFHFLKCFIQYISIFKNAFFVIVISFLPVELVSNKTYFSNRLIFIWFKNFIRRHHKCAVNLNIFVRFWCCCIAIFQLDWNALYSIVNNKIWIFFLILLWFWLDLQFKFLLMLWFGSGTSVYLTICDFVVMILLNHLSFIHSILIVSWFWFSGLLNYYINLLKTKILFPSTNRFWKFLLTSSMFLVCWLCVLLCVSIVSKQNMITV